MSHHQGKYITYEKHMEENSLYSKNQHVACSLWTHHREEYRYLVKEWYEAATCSPCKNIN